MAALIWGAWSSDWALYSKVDFDGINKIIYVNPDVTELDIRFDVYSAWVDWVILRDNAKFTPAIRFTGYDPIGGGQFTGDTYFLTNGWKLSVDLAKVKVSGILYSDNYATAYYTHDLVPQYPATVSALVNNVINNVPAVISAESIAIAVRDALAAELARIDADISTRATPAEVWNYTQ